MQISIVFDVINKATKPLREIDNNFKGMTRTMSRVQGCMWKFNQTSELFQRMGQSVSQLSRPFIEFEQGLADMSAITGIAGEELKYLGQVARKSGVDSGLGATGAIEAFQLLASQIQVSDVGLEGIIKLQKETITLSQASGISMANAATAMAGTINQYGLQADQANRVINVLAAGAKHGAALIPDLSMSLKVVGAAANAAGLDIEATTGALEVLSKNNLKGAEAGTALRNILLKMQTAMGVDFNKTTLAEALETLKPKYKDAAYMSKLFGMENMAAAQFLVANADEVENMTRKVTDTQVATEQAQRETNTWNHRLKVQAARFDEWSMQLTETAPGIMNFIQVGSQGLSMLTSLAPLFSGVAFGVRGIFGAAGGAVKGIGNITKASRLMSSALKAGKLSTYTELIKRYGMAGRIAAAGIWLKNGAVAVWNGICAAGNAITSRAFWLNLRHAAATKLSALWTAVCSKAQLVASAVTSLWSRRTAIATALQGGLTKALRTVKATMLSGVLPALGGVIASTWAWTAALLANPITWIVLAIGALIAAVVICWQKFAEFRAVIYTIWDTIKGFGKAIINWLVAPFKAAWEFVKGIGKAIGTLFKGGSMKDAGAEIAGGFRNGINAGVDSLGKSIDGFKNTAAGISGNYQMHLNEERAKQQQREQEKEQRKNAGAQPAGVDIPEINGYMNTPDMGDFQVPDMPEISGYEGMPDDMGGFQIPDIPASEIAAMMMNETANTPVSVQFTPNITISNDLTQKGREDLIKVLRDNAAEFARIIKDELRRSERGAYGLS